MKFRKATVADIDSIVGIYNRIHDAEEAGVTTIGWIRDIYPTRATAEAALERGDLYLCEALGPTEATKEIEATKTGFLSADCPDNTSNTEHTGSKENATEFCDIADENASGNIESEEGQILATAIINQIQVDVYADVEWNYDAPDDKVSVLHTLVVDPAMRFGGIGKAFVAYWERLAAEKGCTELRMDTNARNTIARAFYAKLGYKEVGIVPTVFNGIPGVNLVMLEKHL